MDYLNSGMGASALYQDMLQHKLSDSYLRHKDQGIVFRQDTPLRTDHHWY